jgi:HSP20 family protein
MKAFERYRRRMPGHLVSFFGHGSLRDEMHRFFWEFYPDVDMIESDNSLKVRIELPGVKKEDLEISLKNSFLIITGEKKAETEEAEESRYYFERKYGSFSRTLSLPIKVNPESIKATCEGGVLEITLLKLEDEKDKEIKIQVD